MIRSNKSLFKTVTINKYGSITLVGQGTLAALGLTFIILGFIVTFAAVLLLLIKNISLKGKTKGGGILMIGPIPIIFGTDKETMKILIGLAIALMIFAVIIMLLPRLII